MESSRTQNHRTQNRKHTETWREQIQIQIIHPIDKCDTNKYVNKVITQQQQKTTTGSSLLCNPSNPIRLWVTHGWFATQLFFFRNTRLVDPLTVMFVFLSL